MGFIDSIPEQRATDLEFTQHFDGIKTVPGYLIDCTDGHRYLVFAPDMTSVRHMHCYQRIMRMIKERFSDHMYDPIRKCIKPAFSSEDDGYGNKKVFHAPVSEMGKIFVIE